MKLFVFDYHTAEKILAWLDRREIGASYGQIKDGKIDISIPDIYGDTLTRFLNFIRKFNHEIN